MQGMQFDVLSDIVEFVCKNIDTTDAIHEHMLGGKKYTLYMDSHYQ